MAVPEAVGGWGADLLDLSLVAEQLGAALVPAPVLELQCTARLLGRLTAEQALNSLDAVLSGDRLITLAVRPAYAGRVTMVPAAAIADELIVLDGDRLLLVPVGPANRTHVQNLAALPLADVTLDGAGIVEVARGAEAAIAYEQAIDEWLVLTASALVGSAAVAHRMTCNYVKDRQAWGAPIGSYQAVSHPLADSATAIDGARLLFRKAALALDTSQVRARELAAMAFAFAAETARDATQLAIHLHGGIGFTLEHDAQLHYRRVRGWARVWGEPRDAYRRAASHRYGW
jgi:alkylation response protein AidB-like acyl-CoA dehydrogenase